VQLLKAVDPIDVIVFVLVLLTKLILSKLGLFAKEFTPIVCIFCPKTDVPDAGVEPDAGVGATVF
jgi:hypothetical protein